MIGKDKVVQPQKSSLQTRCHGSIHVQSTPLALHLNVAAIDPTQAMNIGFCGERNEKGNWDMGLVILTGASGSGKTTIAKTIEVEHPSIAVFRVDTIGVPSAAVMPTYGAGFQPGGAWQRAATLQWLERIAPIVAAGQTVLFEGQMRNRFHTRGAHYLRNRERAYSLCRM
jgi:hypothetical protein